MSRFSALLLVGSLLLATASATAAVSIEHDAVGCVAAGKHPRFEARFVPADSVARGRLYFRPAGWPHWYSVPMKREGASFWGALPKPEKSLARMDYYISATDQEMNEARTAEHAASVVSGPAACQGKLLASTLAKPVQIAVSGPAGVANAPLVPVGFSADAVVAGGLGAAAGGAAAAAGGASAAAAGGGLSTTLLVVGGVVVAGGAAAAVAVSKGGEGEAGVFAVIGNVISRTDRNSGIISNTNTGPALQGGLVSSSLDSETTTTDAQGHFLLTTRTSKSRCKEPGGAVFTVTIAKPGCPPVSENRDWQCGSETPPGALWNVPCP